MDLITTTEAAERLGISVATLNRWAASGRIPVAVQAPGRTGTRMYDPAAIAALVPETAVISVEDRQS